MIPLKVMIVDDEAASRQRLRTFCEDHAEIDLLGYAVNGQEAIEKIDTLKPDLVLLDIQMPDITGIDVLKNISHEPQVIFCTAYDKYAVKAFEHNAVDFLLKPFSKERFDTALERVTVNSKAKPELVGQLQQVLSDWKSESNYLRRIPAKIGDRIQLMKCGNITHFSSENKLVFAHLADKHLAINYTLDELVKRLDPNQFFRIHRSTIVNLDFVDLIEPWFAGSFMMRIKDGKKTELKISRNAAKELKKLLSW